MPRYTGSRSYRLFLYPKQIIFFVFQRAARLAEALIVTALLSYGSGKLRTVKAFLRQAASQNPPRRFLRISGTCRVLTTKRSKKTDQNRSMLIFLRLTSRFISFISFHIEEPLPPPAFHIFTSSFIYVSLDSQFEMDSFSARIYDFSEFNSKEKCDKSKPFRFHFTSISLHHSSAILNSLRAIAFFIYSVATNNNS